MRLISAALVMWVMTSQRASVLKTNDSAVKTLRAPNTARYAPMLGPWCSAWTA